MSPTPEASHCPKCQRDRATDLSACPRCGLVFELWQEAMVPPLPMLDQDGEALWQAARANWDNTAAHEAFIKYCLQVDLLGPAGRLYRERLDQNPKDAVAAAMQKQILSKAALTLDLHKSPMVVPVTRSKWFWLIVLSAMAMGILFGLFYRRFR